MNDIAHELLYARVDLVESDRGPMLIELELTDPSLYMSAAEPSARLFSHAILETLASTRDVGGR